MAVNLRGTFLMVKGFLPGMRELGQGTIVNMVSTDAMPFSPPISPPSRG